MDAHSSEQTVWVPARGDRVLRLVARAVARLVYRLRVAGAENVPSRGGALLVSNHAAWVDVLLVLAAVRRPVRFVMASEAFERRLLGVLLRRMGAIPLAPGGPARRLVRSLREARAAVEEGWLVCLFAEGAMTRNGNLRPFRPGLERIVRRGGFPVLPVHVGGTWGSAFSHCRHGLPGAIPQTATVAIGPPLASPCSAEDARRAVQELAALHFELQKSADRTLTALWIRKARRCWIRPALADTSGRRLSCGRTLAAALALARRLDRMAAGQRSIGIALPASAGAALANLAVSLTGRVAVNLNFTSSAEAVASAVRRCALSTILSSREFVAGHGRFAPPPGTVFLEDLVPSIGGLERVVALVRAALIPARVLLGPRRAGPDDVATVIFSSGTTGEPKGVPLTHHNVLSNIEGMLAVYPFARRDRMCGVLPFFHSFGYACTLWCPLLAGMSVFYHPNPTDGAAVARLVRSERLTILLSTPTFLSSYARRAKREDFVSLRGVIAGSEKLRRPVADLFEAQFGVRPVEGYGATELSPVVSLNVPDTAAGGLAQAGTKEGSVGHPMPGVAVRIVEPGTGRLLPAGRNGMILVKGPNVMAGYLGDPARSAEVLRGGWYETGDLGRVDEDGFLFIEDRVSRFSKIGGEMVPHLAVEDAVAKQLGGGDRPVAVSAAADDRKGEQLVLFYRADAATADTLCAALDASDLPNLWRPRRDNCVEVEALPVTGSGKLDLHRLRQMAEEHVRSRPGLLRRVLRVLGGEGEKQP